MKKYCLLSVLFVLCESFLFPQSYPLGDTNHSGSIDIVDALLVAQYYIDMNPPGFDASLADVDGNGRIDIVDALLIAQYHAGLVTGFPADRNSGCPYTGRITYTLGKASSPTAEQQRAYDLITAAMDKALSYYNCYTDIPKDLWVIYEPSVPTADANINGTIRFGREAYMNYITAMHEIAHTVGVGTDSNWQSLISNGVYTGWNAANELGIITGNSRDELHGDSQHFWPYGLNYTSEVTGTDDLINHCRIVMAIRLDLGY